MTCRRSFESRPTYDTAEARGFLVEAVEPERRPGGFSPRVSPEVWGSGRNTPTPVCLRSCFEHEVEWRLGCAPDVGETALLDHVGELCFAGLGTEGESNFL